TTEFYQNRLRPQVTQVSWSWVGKKDVLVAVEGGNFFSDTRVMMGGKSFDSSNGLKIKSERAFDLLVDGSQFSDAVLQGRYGSAIPLLRADQTALNPLEILRAEWRPVVDGFSTLLIFLSRLPQDLQMLDLPRARPNQAANGVKPDDLLDPQIIFNDTLLP